MATTKTLRPTNVTISIPEFTDQPDQRVNSNCIDKEADAINSLSEQIGTLTPTSVTVTKESIVTSSAQSITAVKSGHIVTVIFNNATLGQNISTDTTIATISGAKPTNQMFGLLKTINGDDVFAFITLDGIVKISGITPVTANKNIYGTFVYITNS